MMWKVCFLVVVVVLECRSDEDTARDSYLDAFQDSHGLNHETKSSHVKTDREYSEPIPAYPGPGGQPTSEYGAPQFGPQYGAPLLKPQYGPPQPQYSYGPPASVQSYGPPAPVYGPPPSYGVPYGMLGLLDKFKFKLDLFTVGKILLKLVIFKKIVGLIAILCLLLFIPSLKHKVDGALPEEDEESMRTYGPKKYKAGDETINNISNFVLEAINGFSQNHTKKEKCQGVFCRAKKVLYRINTKITDEKVRKLYSKEIN